MSDYKKPFVDLSTLLPQSMRNRTNDSVLKNVFNKMLTKDESLPLLGYIGDRLITDLRPSLPQPNLERELNTLQPVVYAKIGSEEHVFTFNDVIQKLKLLGVDTDEMDSWAKAKSFNFVPPIDLDKFINYPRYYWYGALQTNLLDTLLYNPSLDAEYYTIGLPGNKLLQLTDVDAVCTDTTFSLSTPPDLVDDVVLTPGSRVLAVNRRATNVSSDPLNPTPRHAECGIYVVNDDMSWSRAADLNTASQFKTGAFVMVRTGSRHGHTAWTLEVPPFMALGNTDIMWTRSTRKVSDWTINNFWAHEDDLRLMGINPADCVQALAPIIEYDFNLELNDTVLNGKPVRPHASVIGIEMLHGGAGYDPLNPPIVTIEPPPNYPSVGVFTAEVDSVVNGDGTISISLSNDVHGNPIGGVGYVDAPKITITGGGAWTEEAIAYAVIGTSLNQSVEDTHVSVEQVKYVFNQVPQFNLYYLDGTHASKTSPIFYYSENATQSIDSVLKRRIVRDVNGDYTFEQGLLNDAKMQHFFRISNDLRGIWHPGEVTSPRWVKRGIDGTPVDYPAGPKNKDALYGKASVKAASTQHITSLNGLLTLDEYQTVVGDRVLVKDQLVGAQQENGIYVVGRGYVRTPIVTVVNTKPADYFPTTANIICTINQGRISSFRVIDGGSGYSRMPGETLITLVPDTGVGSATDGEPCTATAVVNETGTITDVLLIDGGHWKRAADADSDAEVLHGMHTFVSNGTKNASTNWALETPNPIIVGTSSLTFKPYEDGEGAWSIPSQMFHNLKHENRKQIGYGDLYEHFFSIIGAQPNLEGSSFGFNNWRHLSNRDLGLGGTIKDYNSSFDLFLSLMNQRDISLLSILDFAQLQYSQSLNTVNEFFTQNVSEFLTSGLLGSLNTVNPNNPIVTGIFEIYKSQVATRADLGSIYADTTNPLTNWPATLPYLGLIYDPAHPTMAKKVKPAIVFDNELGLNVIIHHDGHRSPAIAKNAAYEQALTKTPIARSNGQTAPGLFATTAPTVVSSQAMFKNQLWYNPSNNSLYYFNVTSDTSPIYPVDHGQFYFNRSNGVLYRWNQSLNGNLGDWESHSNIADAWKPFYFHNLLNSLILRIENELYNNVQPQQPSMWNSTDALSSPLLELELAKYAALNNYDMFAPDYVPANAFTWNYSSVDYVLGMLLTPGEKYPARWFNLYKRYFTNSITGLSTCRPNLEPWILTGDTEIAFRTMWNATTFNSPAMWAYVKTRWTGKLCVNIVGTPSTNANYGDLLPPYVNSSAPESAEALIINIPDNINAGYKFGDEGPVELVWRKSLEFNYSVLRTAFRMDPINFISQTWGLNKAVVNEYELDRSSARRESWLEFKLHGDTINNPTPRDLNALFEPLIEHQLRPLSYPVGTDYQYKQDNPLMFAGTNNQDYPLATVDAPVQWKLKDLTLTPVGGIWRCVFVDGDGNEIERAPVAIGSEYRDEWISFTLRDSGIDFELHDRITITYDGQKYSFEFAPSQYKLFNGLNQTYVNLLRYNGSDPSISFNVVMLRGWELKLGYRVSGLINTDTVKMSSDNFSLHKSSFRALLKQNVAQRDSWLDALRIQLVRVGTTQWDATGGYNIPKQGMFANDWQFRIENFNPQHPTITYYNLDTTGSYQTFNALMSADALKARQDAQSTLSVAQQAYQTLLAQPSSVQRDADLAIALQVVQEASAALSLANAKNEEWRVYKDIVIDTANPDETKRTDLSGKITRTLPFTVTGLQNVLNVLYGYIMRLMEDGWSFNSGDNQIIDQETGRAIGWQLDIEKFIYNTYNGAIPGAGNVLNPFMANVWFNTPTGMLSTFDRPLFSDISTSQLVFDVLGGTISKSNLRVFRQDEDTEVVSNIPMMSAHFLVDDYEHVILFTDYNDMSQQKDLIYDPFLGVRINRIYVEGQRQMYFNGRPSYGGHYLYGQEVRKNIEASVEGILNYYDANEISNDNPTAKAARELLGYQKKDYMAQIGMSDQSQFHFWRGLIHNKGSNNSMEAFLNSAKFKSASMDEYWAVKIAEYGDDRVKSFPELKLKASDCIHSYTRLQFIEGVLTDSPDNSFTQIVSTDEARWFSIDDVGTHLYFDAEQLGIVDFTDIEGDYKTLPWSADTVSITGPGVVINNTTLQRTGPGLVTVIGYGPAKPRFSPVKLIDYAGKQVISEIPIWDPARGVHQVNASEVIDVTGSVDPARYNFSVQTVGNTNYDPLRPWGVDQIGKTWFDTTNLGYVPYNDEHIFPSTDERLSRWGVPADWATIDIYEWVGAKVPPSEWDAISKAEEGNAEIPVELRASGKVARKELYVRERTWKERPIAWSYSDDPQSVYHQLTSSGLASIVLTGVLEGVEKVVLEYGSFASFGVTAGMHISAIDLNTDKPLGEGILEGVANYQIGGYDIASWEDPWFDADSNFSDMRAIPSPTGDLGSVIGPITLSSVMVNGSFYLRATSLNLNQYQDIEIVDTDNLLNSTVTYDFAQLGIAIAAEVNFDHDPITGIGTASNRIAAVAMAFGNIAHEISVRETMNINIFIPFDVNAQTMNNDELVSNYGWKAYNIPTAAELAADLVSPLNRWEPYYGDYVELTYSAPVRDRLAKYATAPLVFVDGTLVNKVVSEWSNWLPQRDERITHKYLGQASDLVFDFSTVPSNVSVYVNGLIQPFAKYTVVGNVLTVSITTNVGYDVTVINRRYKPSDAELSFDPTVEDDPKINVQYKFDYQCVIESVRDTNGNITAVYYYFWVYDKSTPTKSNKMSIKNATALIKNNAYPYMVLMGVKDSYRYVSGFDVPQSFLAASTVFRLSGNGNTYQLIPLISGSDIVGFEPVPSDQTYGTDPVIEYSDDGILWHVWADDATPIFIQHAELPTRYTKVAIKGLNQLVTQDNMYKLRFTRDFTLRDSDEEVKLKNVHAEWSLIREAQLKRIPSTLWDRLVDAACGQNAGGELLPTQSRIDYDLRHNTATRYGTGTDQILVDTDVAKKSILNTILNTKITYEQGGAKYPDYIADLDFGSLSGEAQVADRLEAWFGNLSKTRETLTKIWNSGKPRQINEIFFAVLHDALSANIEMTDIFKTSYLSVYSVRLLSTVDVLRKINGAA